MRAIRDSLSAIGLAAVILAAASPARADVSDRIARVVPLLPGTPVSVQLTVGRLVIGGWDRPEMSVEIVRRAPDMKQLASIPAHVEQAAGAVIVRAVQAGDSQDPRLNADVVLRVPVGTALRDIAVFEGRIELTDLRGGCSARLERGEIVGTRLAGAVRLETTIGNIRVTGATVSPESTIRLRTFNGDVALELASSPRHARILALSMGGTITSEVPLTLRERRGPRFGEATIGRGEPVISVDVVNGNVVITVADAKQ